MGTENYGGRVCKAPKSGRYSGHCHDAADTPTQKFKRVTILHESVEELMKNSSFRGETDLVVRVILIIAMSD